MDIYRNLCALCAQKLGAGYKVELMKQRKDVQSVQDFTNRYHGRKPDNRCEECRKAPGMQYHITSKRGA